MSVRWFYISTSCLAGADVEEQVRNIVNESIPRNRSLGVTGALLFTGVRFSQYLEGPSDAVAELKASIRRDARHTDIETLAEGACPHRKFLTWSLAYAGLSHFVAAKVEAAMMKAAQERHQAIESLAQLLAEFATGGSS